MLVLEGKSWNRLVLQMGSSKGCVVASTLYSIFLSKMLDEAFRDMGDGVYIQSRQSADLFNVAHLRAKTTTARILVRETLFADDNALVAHSAEKMQNIMDQEDRGAVPTQLYENPRGGYHG